MDAKISFFFKYIIINFVKDLCLFKYSLFSHYVQVANEISFDA